VDTEGAGAFWSYTHLDDEAESNRIVQLAHDLKAQYGVLSGGELRLFLDKDELEWGDDLRAGIDKALADTTFFIPIVTPRYFQSDEGRRELIAFSEETKRLKVESLLLPIYYVDVPELSAHGEPSDLAMRLVKEPKWEDWRSLALEDRSSSEYRKGVRRLAQRLADVVRELTEAPPELTPPVRDISPKPNGSAAAADDEEPGLLELVAEGEEALPEWQRIVESISPEMEKLGTVATAAAEEIAKSDARGAGASGRLRVAIKLAEEMRPHADAILNLGQANANVLVKLDPAINALIDQLDENPEELQVEGVAGFLDTIRSLAASGRESVKSLQELSASLDVFAKFARALRPPVRDIQGGLRGFVDAQAIFDAWEKRVDELELPTDDRRE
jgi:TIR domain-containing protein